MYRLLVSLLLLCLFVPAQAQDAPARALPLLPDGTHISINYAGAEEGPQAAAAALDSAWDGALRAGISSYALSVPWSELEPDGDGLNAEFLAQIEQWLAILDIVDLQPYIVLPTIDTVNLRLPADLMHPDDPARMADGLRFDDPQVLERFGALLDALVPLLAEHGAFYIAVGNEVDGWLSSHPEQQAAFTNFVAFSRERVHAIAPEIAVGATVMYGGIAQGYSFIDELWAVSDAASVTYYPLNPDMTVRAPGVVAGDLAQVVQAIGDLPLLLQEIGYPSGYVPMPNNGSSVEQQRQFVAEVFDVLATTPQIRFASFLLLNDWSDATCDFFTGYYRLAAPRFREYLCSLGFVENDGTPKPAYDEFLRQMTAFQSPPAQPQPAASIPESSASRSFRMGFTPFPFDLTQAAQDATYQGIAANGDLILHHMDTGIPWPEALAGDAYHPAVLDNIEQRLRQSRDGQPVYLAITPNGSERNELAGYWAQEESLPLPQAWQGRRFDDPQVIAAFLNHARFMIEQFEPDYFAYGIEVTCGYRGPDDAAFDSFLRFAEQVYPALKAEYPDLPIFATICAISLEYDKLDDLIDANRQVVAFSDLIGLSIYPYFVGEVGLRGTADPARLPQDWLSRWADLDPAKPFAITETGYIAEDLVLDQFGVNIVGSPQGQAAYAERLLSEANRLDAAFVIWFFLRDFDAFVATIERFGIDGTLFNIWRDTGLIDEAGQPRPAYRVWESWLIRAHQP